MSTATTRAPRVDWVDFAKGICIFFVVMLHTNNHTQHAMEGRGWLQHVVDFALPFRMPDFFLIAGLFLSNVINRPWRVYFDKKVVHFMYFYLLWAFIEFLLFDLRYELRGTPEDSAPLWQHFLSIFINPGTSLWFIYALPIFFVVTRLLKNVPWWLVFAVAAVLQSSHIFTGWTLPDQFALRYVYFFSGYIFAPYIFRIANWAIDNPRWALAYLAMWGVMETYVVSKGWSQVSGISLVLGYLGALAVIFVAGLCSKLPHMNWLRYLGEHSLVVYLGYYVAMSVFIKLLTPAIPDIGTAALLVTICSVAATIVMYRLANGSRLGFLYTRPEWAKLRLIPRPGPDVALAATPADWKPATETQSSATTAAKGS